MPFRYKEHQADVGIVGEGASAEEAFEEAAKAMFNIMVDIDGVKQKDKIEFSVKAPTLEQLLVTFLNELLTQKDIKRMFFSQFFVNIHRNQNEFSLRAKAFGEKIDLQRHIIKTEVKAATYSGLKVYDLAGKSYAECLVDV
ncbi:MAG: archease [Candidatus Aenigmatarchaeota archaeon]